MEKNPPTVRVFQNACTGVSREGGGARDPQHFTKELASLSICARA